MLLFNLIPHLSLTVAFVVEFIERNVSVPSRKLLLIVQLLLRESQLLSSKFYPIFHAKVNISGCFMIEKTLKNG